MSSLPKLVVWLVSGSDVLEPQACVVALFAAHL
jgi:hypothetical protein